MAAEPFRVRRVVVGRDADGRPSLLSDTVPPLTIAAPTGFGVSELLASPGPLTSADAGGDPPREAVGAFPQNGGVAARLIRFPATGEWIRIAGDDPDRPGMHSSETLDLMVVLSGRIVLGVEDGDTEVGPGDAVIQRGTLHRWRVTGTQPCTYLSVLLAPIDGPPAPSVPPVPLPRLQAGGSPRLFVTGQGLAGSTISLAGTSAPDEQGRRRWWDTGGAVRTVDQGAIGGRSGGDRDPLPGTVSLTMVDLAVAGSAGWHTSSSSIDLVLVRSGTVTAALTQAGMSATSMSTANMPSGNASTEGTTPASASPSGTPSVGSEDSLAQLSLSAGEVLITRAVALRLTSTDADVAVVSFTPATY